MCLVCMSCVGRLYVACGGSNVCDGCALIKCSVHCVCCVYGASLWCVYGAIVV